MLNPLVLIMHSVVSRLVPVSVICYECHMLLTAFGNTDILKSHSQHNERDWQQASSSQNTYSYFYTFYFGKIQYGSQDRNETTPPKHPFRQGNNKENAMRRISGSVEENSPVAMVTQHDFFIMFSLQYSSLSVSPFSTILPPSPLYVCICRAPSEDMSLGTPLIFFFLFGSKRCKGNLLTA